MNRTQTGLRVPALAIGALLGSYLLLRPYGDQLGNPAQALASGMWVFAHVCGMLGIAAIAWFAHRLTRTARTTRSGAPDPAQPTVTTTSSARNMAPARNTPPPDASSTSRIAAARLSAPVARTSSLFAVVLTLPYYGTEAFALNVLGRQGLQEIQNAPAPSALGNPSALALVDQVRNQPVALSMFALGLVCLVVTGAAIIMTPPARATRWSVRLLGLVIALLPMQFWLPPVGRMAYGMAAVASAVTIALTGGRDQPDGPQ